jgi:hypothetical protein
MICSLSRLISLPISLRIIGHSNTFPCYRDFKSKDCEANPVFGRIIDQLAFLKKFDMPGAEEFENLPSLAQSNSFESLRLPPSDNTDQGKCKRKRWPLIDRNPGCLTGGGLQNKPQSIPPEKGLIRLCSDGQHIVLVCSYCKADRFSDPADFDEHCRVVHAKEYENENERDMACGQIVQKGSSGWVISQDQGLSDALGLEPVRMHLLYQICPALTVPLNVGGTSRPNVP